MEAFLDFIDRTDRPIRWGLNVRELYGVLTSVTGGGVTWFFSSLGIAALVTAALYLLSLLLVPQMTADRVQRFLDKYHPSNNACDNNSDRKQKRHSANAIQKFRQRALCGQHEITTDGRIVSHVGNPTGSFTTPNGPHSRNGERVIFVCNYCHAAGELVRLADGRRGLLHRATDGPVEVVAVHPEPTAIGKG